MANRVLDFRGIIGFYSYPRRNPSEGMIYNSYPPGGAIDFWDKKTWEKTLTCWGAEGYNTVVWYGPNEFGAQGTGEHLICRHEEFPEAREIPPEENEKIIAQMKWLHAAAKRLGMRNFFYVHSVWVTPAFAKAHDLYKPMPVSETVSRYHSTQPQCAGLGMTMECGVRNEWTRKYTEAVYAEVFRIYKDLDGLYGHPGGETCPGERTSWFREAIAPGLRRCGRKPLMVAVQWQCTIEGWRDNVAPKEVYDNVWLGWHAYNAESITDAKPYPGLVNWMETLDLPTVASIYHENIDHLPFNSPRFAWEITHEMKKHVNFRGFLYFPWYSQVCVSRLFRHALAYYGAREEQYSDAPWLSILQEEFGDREAAQHFLNAYNASGRILPELSALLYRGNNYTQRELRIPYDYLSRPNWRTSPARGLQLVPLTMFAEWVAQNPINKNRNGSEYWLPPNYEQAPWMSSEGGSLYNIIPPAHMAAIRAMGEECLREAEQGLKVSPNKAAEKAYNWMKAYQLLSRYYELKVNAGIAASVYARTARSEDKEETLNLADKALAAYVEANRFIAERCNPAFMELAGRPMQEVGKNLDELLELERAEREKLPLLFQWAGPS